MFGKKKNLFRGDVKQPRRAKLICPHPGCIPSYCSAACLNVWHRNEEMPTNIEDFDGCKGSEGLHAGGAVGGEAKEDGAGSKAMSEDSESGSGDLSDNNLSDSLDY